MPWVGVRGDSGVHGCVCVKISFFPLKENVLFNPLNFTLGNYGLLFWSSELRWLRTAGVI